MRSVFVAVSAFLGRIESETRCAIWTDEPTDHGFDASRLIAIDLSKTPSAAASHAIGWDEVEVDDLILGPAGNIIGTSLGTAWPELQLTGLVMMEQQFWQKLPEPLRPRVPPLATQGRDYEYSSALYWPGSGDPRAGKRYAGHHARILEERAGISKVEVFPPGQSQREGAATATMWIDLSSSEQCDAGADSLTAIGPGDRPKEGPLYLIVGHMQPSN